MAYSFHLLRIKVHIIVSVLLFSLYLGAIFFYSSNLNGQNGHHWAKKGISLQWKHKGNHMETTSLQHISMGFPSLKLHFSMWFLSRGNTLGSSLHASMAWKLGSTSGFPLWKIGGNYMETPGFQRETLGKPQ